MAVTTAEASMKRVAGPAGIRLLDEADEKIFEDGREIRSHHGARNASTASASFTSRAVTPPASWLHRLSVTSV